NGRHAVLDVIENLLHCEPWNFHAGHHAGCRTSQIVGREAYTGRLFQPNRPFPDIRDRAVALRVRKYSRNVAVFGLFPGSDLLEYSDRWRAQGDSVCEAVLALLGWNRPPVR